MEIQELKPTIEFNPLKVLKLIENNQFLDRIFRDGDSNLSYNLLYSMVKQDNIPSETIENLRQIFERIILTKSKLKQDYVNLDDLKELVSDIPLKNKASKYYGKRRILKDAEANGGKLTELDRAMLAINTLRNITAKLRNRGRKDKTANTNILSDSDCRDIIAVVRIVENKLVNVLNKK
jgi:hypothetical protein